MNSRINLIQNAAKANHVPIFSMENDIVTANCQLVFVTHYNPLETTRGIMSLSMYSLQELCKAGNSILVYFLYSKFFGKSFVNREHFTVAKATFSSYFFSRSKTHVL